jgi:three-Cys-motif partner protein
MSKKISKNFHWSSDGQLLPETEAHSKAKHQVLEDYVKNWILTLCGNNIGSKKTVTLIDGFCGGGVYRDPENRNELWYGSPIRMIHAVQEGLKAVQTEKGKPGYELNVKFIFIDENKDYLDCLKLQMANVGLQDYLDDTDKCEFICGEFENLVDKVLQIISSRKGSSFFFLDPLGYTDVSMESLRKIINFGKSEVLYTFMIDFIQRFLTERDSSLEIAFSQVLEADGYYQDFMSYKTQKRANKTETQAKQQYLRNETMRLFRHKGTATYVYSFALLPNKGTVKYYLIHLASNATAQKVMKESLWTVNNLDFMYQFRYGVYGLGFRAPDYYERNLRVFDFKDSNVQAAIDDLTDSLIPIIHEADDGVLMQDLHQHTMQTNPAIWQHYEQLINEQRSNKEIEVFRDGKITSSRKIKPGDVIIKSIQPKLFDLGQY